ncbi:hypothetical protein, partial [Pectobacterium versatile]|uniref:hypothetical protein n=1 Tax=Pectobacterium versatile TaxID=2488639 RepID=UPI0032EBE9CB
MVFCEIEQGGSKKLLSRRFSGRGKYILCNSQAGLYPHNYPVRRCIKCVADAAGSGFTPTFIQQRHIHHERDRQVIVTPCIRVHTGSFQSALFI